MYCVIISLISLVSLVCGYQVAPVYLYYQLTSFYANHRLYVKSRDDAQLQALPDSISNINSLCEPRSIMNTTDGVNWVKVYVDCCHGCVVK